MSKYIENLTNDIVLKNNYWITFGRFRNRPNDFIGQVSEELENREVRKMSPETLGRIMCSLGCGDVMTTKEELFSKIGFGGSCEEMLRQLVARCLAHAIWERFSQPKSPSSLPPFRFAKPYARDGIFDGLGDYEHPIKFVRFIELPVEGFKAVFENTVRGGRFNLTAEECSLRAHGSSVYREVLTNWPKKQG